MKAIVLTGRPGTATLVNDRPKPRLRPGYILVETKAVALNPADWRQVDYINTAGSLLGGDVAGVVLEVGPGCSKQWVPGDRICGFVYGGNESELEDGAFAEQVLIMADIGIRIPEWMTFEEAATMGMGVVTCGQGLFQQMRLNRPSQGGGDGNLVLIYGGSSATGTLGIQFANLAGYTVITTCSPQHFEMVKSLGTAAAFDYRSPTCVEEIRAFTKGDLDLVWNTIDSPAAVDICAAVIAPRGHYGTIASPADFSRNDVETSFSMGYTAFGGSIHMPMFEKKDCTEDAAFASGWIAEAEALLGGRSIKPHPSKVEGGIEAVLEGLNRLRNGEVSGVKLVYTV